MKPDEHSRNVEEITVLLEKRWNIKQIEKSKIKIEHYKIPKLLNDSTYQNLWQRNGLKQMIYQVVNILFTKIQG